MSEPAIAPEAAASTRWIRTAGRIVPPAPVLAAAVRCRARCPLLARLERADLVHTGTVSVSGPPLDYSPVDAISAQIFYPRPDPSRPPEGVTDLRIPVADGVELAARLHPCPGGRATIVLFHGNGEVVGDYDGVARDYVDCGCALLVSDFRGYGRSDGHPTFSAMVRDAGVVFEQLLARRRALDLPGVLIVKGRSLGAHCALEVAARHAADLAGLVIESGSGELSRLAAMLGLDPADPGLVALLEAHDAKLASIELPVLMIHGERDELIPLASAESTLARLGSRRRRIEVIPGAGHNDLWWRGRARYFEALERFVLEVTAGGGG